VRALRFGLTYDAGDALGGVNIADFEFSQGIAGLGASNDGDEYLSRQAGRADFRRVALYAARLQSLPSNWSVVVGVNAQYAFTELLSPELFGFGGEQFGRGYDFAELLNDHGAAMKLDLRYSHTWNRGSGNLTPTLMPYGFVDAGQVWQRTPYPGIDGTQSAVSAGVGTSLNFGGRISSFVEFARPLTRVVGQESDRDGRIYAGISIQ
jgi:hemolysin activation/secretion protein